MEEYLLDECVFVYTMSREMIRACTKISIRRMYIIESIDEMCTKYNNRVGVSLLDYRGESGHDKWN